MANGRVSVTILIACAGFAIYQALRMKIGNPVEGSSVRIQLSTKSQLAKERPNGIDVHFEGVGRAVLEAALPLA